MLVLATVVTAVAGSYENGVWVNKDSYCEEWYRDTDGNDVPQCMGSVFGADGEERVCSKVGYKCQIDGCGTRVLKGADGSDLPKCAVIWQNTKNGGKGSGGNSNTGSGQVLFPQPSPASSGMRDTVVTNPMRGWMDMKDSEFNRFPRTVVGRKALVPSVRTEAGYKMILECTDGYGGMGGFCDHFVFLYSCPPCTFAEGGNLEASLLADGWVPHRCEAYFDFDINYASAEHPFVIYHKQTMQGNDDVIVPSELLEFVFYANTPATSYCPAHMDEAACTGNIPAECAWKNGACEPHLCPRPFVPKGPFPKQRCQVCPHDASEERFLPPMP
eukprot:TRINITY_DN8_c0_g4_i2.p1 TRINITY_DN8_c0_g4~~TRINITY_DN8_c0_g4_i2.p1  ORF type:complete len:355 (+),score=119.39 TRINITY_DN8_c0_g4_i2:81-1067(+)